MRKPHFADFIAGTSCGRWKKIIYGFGEHCNKAQARTDGGLGIARK
jgi:hypothetical protein